MSEHLDDDLAAFDPDGTLQAVFDDLHTCYVTPLDEAVAQRHLDLLDAELRKRHPSNVRRLLIAGGAVVGALTLTTGLAAADLLPPKVQDVIATVAEPFGVDLPGQSEDSPGRGGDSPGRSEDAPGQEDPGPGSSEDAPGLTDGDGTPGDTAPGQGDGSPSDTANDGTPGDTAPGHGDGPPDTTPAGPPDTVPGDTAPGRGDGGGGPKD
jgi:hypothetical protein